MEKEYISIKEFADAVGVSQQAIYKQLNKELNNKLKPYLKVVEKKKMLEKTALSLFEKEEKNNQVEQRLNNELNERLIDLLQKELEEKDKQIARLHELLSQEQYLNAQNNEKIMLLESKLEEPKEEVKIESVEPRKKWWKFF